MYREVTIVHAIKLNAILTKKHSCGHMRVSLLDFRRLTVANRGDRGLVAVQRRGFGGVGDDVLYSLNSRSTRLSDALTP